MKWMQRPVIGLTTDSSDSDDRYMSTITYAAAIERAGGLPLLLPYAVDPSLIPQYVDLLDGICFTGGNDMDPKKYCDEAYCFVSVDALNDAGLSARGFDIATLNADLAAL